MKCAFKGCGDVVKAKGWCSGHYNQQNRGDELKPLQKQFHGLSELDRFEKRVAKNVGGCWLWTASTNNGYGQFRNDKGGIELAHRAALRLYRGIDAGRLYVLHKCDNPLCVNPDHTYVGTQTDNMRDMWERKRGNPGKVFGSKHGCAKILEQTVREIRASLDPVRLIAEKHGISKTNVYDIRSRKTWKHVK